MRHVGAERDSVRVSWFFKALQPGKFPFPSSAKFVSARCGEPGSEAPISVLHRGISKRWAPFSVPFADDFGVDKGIF
jgi:hypothetical protein